MKFLRENSFFDGTIFEKAKIFIQKIIFLYYMNGVKMHQIKNAAKDMIVIHLQ